MEYTGRISPNEYQICDVTWLPDADKRKDRQIPLEFDIVRWYHHEPQNAYDIVKKKIVTSTEHCCSIGFLVWNPNEPEFELRSVGLRWLEEGEIPMEFIKEARGFCDVMRCLLIDNDLEEATIADLPRVHELWKEWEATLHDLLSRV